MRGMSYPTLSFQVVFARTAHTDRFAKKKPNRRKGIMKIVAKEKPEVVLLDRKK